MKKYVALLTFLSFIGMVLYVMSAQASGSNNRNAQAQSKSDLIDLSARRGGGRSVARGSGGGRYAGRGRSAYHRGTVARGPRGGVAASRTAVVRGPRGNVAARRTTVVGRPGYGGGVRWTRPANYWWRPGAAIAAGAAIGWVGATAAASYAGAAPGPNMCWYYTDAARTQGFWDACP